uniref:(northern house mosquito) hypothetical protein n=1 Tax=Culex pipiens TaxID=7175 RepID=A0A8D8DUQ1_CULPI
MCTIKSNCDCAKNIPRVFLFVSSFEYRFDNPFSLPTNLFFFQQQVPTVPTTHTHTHTRKRSSRVRVQSFVTAAIRSVSVDLPRPVAIVPSFQNFSTSWAYCAFEAYEARWWCNAFDGLEERGVVPLFRFWFR